ncbi:hypothetical protein P9A16_32500 [Shinella sp. 838]|uniref:hypothetical protein n=1 Tax=Shinella sp. 838 TaxID=3038164 RepID=UPI00241538E7|nr:hypothetical protein [Shinella sp. 838]MDG4675824.1 hypothetical protein [Shinella sp. 838]
MAKRTEKPIYAFIRRGHSLVPEMQYDLQALDGIQQGQRVKLEIKQWRNLDRLKAYWATLQECIDATGCAPSKEALDAYIRPAVNFVDTIRLANGFLVGIPRPINTSQCDEPEMIAFFNAATELLAREFGFVAPTPGERKEQKRSAA